jgi:hypothetical protein
MDVALVGFAGVLVGAVVAIMGSWLIAIRAELNDAIVAARLIEVDLALVQRTEGDSEPSTAIWTANSVALAKALGYRQWKAVAEVYRGGHPSAADLNGRLERAHRELKPFAVSKRSAVLQRWRNMLCGNGSAKAS